MFFVVLWEVVSHLKAILDIMTQNRENRKKKKFQNESFLALFKHF